MRAILILLSVIGLTAWAGYVVRKRDLIASVMLFTISGLAAVGLAGAFLGWFGE